MSAIEDRLQRLAGKVVGATGLVVLGLVTLASTTVAVFGFDRRDLRA